MGCPAPRPMVLGELQSIGLWIWVLMLAVAVWLVRAARTEALESFGQRAVKERRASVLALLLPLISLFATIFFVGFSDAAQAGEALAPVAQEAEGWRQVCIWLMLGNAISSMVACALVVLGMLRGTATGFIMLADLATASAAVVSLWALTTNYPPPA